MGGLISGNLDIVIALALIVVVVIVFFISQIGLLPKKSLPFIAAALFAAIGISVFRAHRRKSLAKELEKREEGLKQQEKVLADLKSEMNLSEEELNKAKAEVNKQRAAYQKEILIIETKKKEEIERIDKLPEEDVFREFAQTFGGESS